MHIIRCIATRVSLKTKYFSMELPRRKKIFKHLGPFRESVEAVHIDFMLVDLFREVWIILFNEDLPNPGPLPP